MLRADLITNTALKLTGGSKRTKSLQTGPKRVCFRDHAVLASPTSEEMLYEILKITQAQVNKGQSYFIGAHSKFSPGHFVSIEGIPIENMPVANMIHRLNQSLGECLSIAGNEITVTSCARLLPYICYKKSEPITTMTSCGTLNNDNKFEPTTGSCYKLHEELRTWEEANSICISEGGYLVIVNNNEEASLVHNMFPSKYLKTKPNHTWGKEWDPLFIGLRDWGNYEWRSIHGEPIEQLYNGWQDGEPSRNNQLCAGIIRKGGLDNVYCNVNSFFVCEKDPHNIRCDRQ